MQKKISFISTAAIVLIFFLCPVQAKAASETPLLQKCLDAVDLGGLKITQWTACWAAEFIRQDRELNSIYVRIQKISSPELKRSLIKGQRAWLAYRDAWCSYEEFTPVAPGGSANKAACMVDVTITQINRLKNSSTD